MNVDRWCGGSERDNIEVLRENPVPSSTLSTTKLCLWTGLKLNLGLSGEEMIEVKTYAFCKLSSGTGQTRLTHVGGMHQERSSLKHSTACFSYHKLYILSTLSYLYVMLIRHSICFCKHNLTI